MHAVTLRSFILARGLTTAFSISSMIHQKIKYSTITSVSSKTQQDNDQQMNFNLHLIHIPCVCDSHSKSIGNSCMNISRVKMTIAMSAAIV